MHKHRKMYFFSFKIFIYKEIIIVQKILKTPISRLQTILYWCLTELNYISYPHILLQLHISFMSTPKAVDVTKPTLGVLMHLPVPTYKRLFGEFIVFLTEQKARRCQ